VGIVAVAACGDAKRPTPGALPLAMQSPGPTTLLRLPSHGGTVQAYRSGDLSKLDWQVAKVPAIRRVVGADLDQALVYVVDSARSLLAIDLRALGVTPPVPSPAARCGGCSAGVSAAGGFFLVAIAV